MFFDCLNLTSPFKSPRMEILLIEFLLVLKCNNKYQKKHEVFMRSKKEKKKKKC